MTYRKGTLKATFLQASLSKRAHLERSCLPPRKSVTGHRTTQPAIDFGGSMSSSLYRGSDGCQAGSNLAPVPSRGSASCTGEFIQNVRITPELVIGNCTDRIPDSVGEPDSVHQLLSTHVMFACQASRRSRTRTAHISSSFQQLAALSAKPSFVHLHSIRFQIGPHHGIPLL